MNWGKGIILAFVAFGLFISVLVVVCVREDVSLVSKDYYQDELAYQTQIDRLKNANSLAKKPVMRISGDFVEIDFPDLSTVEKGTLKLFRPSDSKFDKNFLLQNLSGSVARIDVSGMPKGMYRAQMTWTMQGKEFFTVWGCAVLLRWQLPTSEVLISLTGCSTTSEESCAMRSSAL